MNIKNLKYYSKIFALTLATSITLSGCESSKNINLEVEKIESTEEDTNKSFLELVEDSFDSVTSIQIEFDNNMKYLVTGKVSDEEIDGIEASLNDVGAIIKRLTNLEAISISSNQEKDIDILKYIVNKDKIKHISISSKVLFEDINFLDDFVNTEKLFLSINSKDYSSINNLKNMMSLSLYGCSGDDSYLPAIDLPELRLLAIFPNEYKEYNKDFINSISNSRQLETFTARNVEFEDTNFLEELTDLSYLDLGNCGIFDISALENLTNLEYVYLDNNRITNISSLYNLPNLKYVQLNGNYLSKRMFDGLQEKGIFTEDEADNFYQLQNKSLIKK